MTIAFLVGGLALIASEAAYLSLVQVFFGVSALMVAGLRAAGVIDSAGASLLLWSFMSVAMALPLRPLARKYFKTGESRHDHSDENRDAMGEIVEVVEEISDGHPNGRVRFQGTTWAAQTTEGTIPAGSKAKLMVKDKTVWIVEPLGVLDSMNTVPVLQEETAQERRGKK